MAITSFAPPAATLRQLQYVVAVAEEGNFRRAAARCAVSQPSLSAQIAEVESALGVRLFERGTRGVLLTPAGEELVARARAVLLEVADLEEAARRFVDPLAGTLRLGIIPTIAPYLLPVAAPALREAFPRLEPIWIEERTAQLVEMLGRGALDGASVALEAELGDLEHEVLRRDPFVLAVPADHPLGRKRGRVDPAELDEARLLLLSEGHCFREQALAVCSRPQDPGLRATSLATLVQMVAAGQGVTLLPSIAVRAETEHAPVRIRAFAEPVPHRTLAVVWRKRSPLADALRAIAARLRKQLPGR